MDMDDKNRFKVIAVVLAVVVLGVGAWVVSSFGTSDQEAALILSEEEIANLPVANVGDGKIVYTFDVSADKEVLTRDCGDRGGEFNECGVGCESDECALVCAYTCEF